MLSHDDRISPERPSTYLTYLDHYSSEQDSTESRLLEEKIINGQFQWRQLVEESKRSPPSKTLLKETIASIYFGGKEAPPKPLSHWLFTLETQQELKFLRDLSPTLDLDIRDEHGNSALHCAVTRNTPEIIPQLLAQGANPNTPNTAGDSPLHLAVHKDNLQALEALLEDRRTIPDPIDRTGYTPLKRAILWKQLRCVVTLTNKGARVDARTVLLAQDSLTGDPVERSLINHLMAANWKQNASFLKSRAYALTATMLITASAWVAGLYLTGLLQEAAKTDEVMLLNLSQTESNPPFEKYFE